MKAIIDLHTHTIASGHAYSTIKENINGAIERGIEILGISDHGPAMPGGTHVFYFNNLKVINREIDKIKILKGVEANIVNYDGELDIDNEILDSLDYVIASLHPPCISFREEDEVTECLIKVMKNPRVNIIGHPDDSRYPINYEELAKAAKENDVLLELNNSSLKKDGFRVGAIENAKKMLEMCMKYRTMIIMNSDAHIYYDVGNFENCETIIEEMNFPKELVLNYSKDMIKKKFEV